VKKSNSSVKKSNSSVKKSNSSLKKRLFFTLSSVRKSRFDKENKFFFFKLKFCFSTWLFH
jgi:hypothetical protein